MTVSSVQNAVIFHTPEIAEQPRIQPCSEIMPLSADSTKSGPLDLNSLDIMHPLDLNSLDIMQERYAAHIDRMRFTVARAGMSSEIMRLHVLDLHIRTQYMLNT